MKQNFKFYLLIFLQLITVLLLTLFIKQSNPKKDIAPDLKLALQLHNAGVISEAALHYENFLNSQSTNDQMYANYAFTLGELYYELGNLPRAISWFYLVEMRDPKSKNIPDAKKRIVEILERLGKTAAAKMELAQQTTIDADKKKNVTNDPLIAKVGSTSIYKHQLQKTLDQLPAELKKNFSGKDGEIQLIQKIVSEELLFQKANKLNIAANNDFVAKLQEIKRQLLIETVFKKEIEEKVTVEEDDLKNYFSANQSKFSTPLTYQTKLLVTKEKQTAENIFQHLQKKGFSSKLCKENEVSCQDLTLTPQDKAPPYPPEKTNLIFKKSAKSAVEPILHQGKYNCLWIESIAEEKTYQLDQIKDIVTQSYKLEKSKNLYQQLIEQALKTEEVEIYWDKIKTDE